MDLSIPQIRDVTIGTFADDTVALFVDKYAVVASSKLQTYLISVSEWLLNWKIKANEAKSVQVTFTTKHSSCPEVKLNDVSIPQAENAKYLGIHLDRRLSWRTHIFTKRKALGLKRRTMHWLIGPQSKLSPENKLLLYKAILKPVLTYGAQLWGTASISN